MDALKSENIIEKNIFCHSNCFSRTTIFFLHIFLLLYYCIIKNTILLKIINILNLNIK